MEKVFKRIIVLTLVFSIVSASQVLIKAANGSANSYNGVNNDAPHVTDISGIGLDFSIPTPTPNPNDSKPEVKSGYYTYKVLGDGTAMITHYSGKGGALTIPSTINKHTVTELGEGSFKQCNIKSVKLPDSLKLIDDDALAANQLTSVTIPKNVKYIDFGAFVVNQQLKSVTVLSSDTTFGWGVFEFCSGDLAFYAPKGSAAEVYAKDGNQRFKFVAKPAKSAAPSKSAPAIPASFTATQAPMKNKTSPIRDVKCKWAAVNGATGYEVYHAGYGPFGLAGSTKKTLSFTIPSLETGVKHYFKVRAYKIVNGTKVYGAYSPIKYILVKDPYLDN